ncbi:MAG: efflux RND transporter periplasmic adaptor subunit [Thermoanaerobaculia bacterium]
MALASGLSAGCRKPAPAAQPSPPTVGVLTIEPLTLPATLELPGELHAYRRVEVRSNVTGILTERLFEEGTHVRKGQVLFRIDDARYGDDLASAQAQVAQTQARVAQNRRDLARLTPLLAEHAVSQKDVDDATTDLQTSQAAERSAQATATRARRDYEDTRIRAEMDGRAEKAPLAVGGRVTGPADLLTTIERIDPIYATFSVSDQERLRWLRDVDEHRIESKPEESQVELTLSDGTAYPVRGRIDFESLRFSPTTGTMMVRAAVPNPKETLLPGQFVRVRMTGARRVGALVVPQRAVQEGIGGRFVYVLGPGDVAQARTVTTGPWIGQDWLIEDGLKAGDRVVVDGIQHVIPEKPVSPQPARTEPPQPARPETAEPAKPAP